MTEPSGPAPVESFAALTDVGVAHGFVGRVAGIDVRTDRGEALARLDAKHREARQMIGVGERIFATAEQVHGCEIAVLAAGEDLSDSPVSGADGLITDRRDVCLGIYVADCCAVYIVDPVRKVVALVHSGKKGTELCIAARTVETMRTRFGSEPRNLTVQLSPCIRPPWYEVDFASEIAAQCRAAGVGWVVDGGVCTAENPDLYYSYRREKGRTGRMLALLAIP